MQSEITITSQPLDFPTRDGVRLSGQYWPAESPSQQPLVLCRSAQPLSHLVPFAEALARHGFPIMLQSVRGRGASRGKFRPYIQELEDGEDTVLALARAGILRERRILAIGLGYDGQAAVALSLGAPPEYLCGLAVGGVSVSHFHSGLCTNGLPTGISLYRMTRWLPKNAYLSRAAFAAWLAQPRWTTGLSPFASVPSLEEWILELRATPIFSSFWKHPALCPNAYLRKLPDLPTFLATGTSATTCAGTMSLAQQLSSRNSAPLELWMGDWNDDTLEDYAPSTPVVQRLLDWLIGFSQKISADALGERNIHYLIQEVGDQQHWHQWYNWPSLSQNPQELYLAKDCLVATPPTVPASGDFLDNPLSPPPSCGIGSWSFAPCDPRFGEYHLPLAVRGDVLAFTSAPFFTPTTLLGSPRVRLRVSTNRADTQFLARLVVVPAIGTARAIGYGASRLSLRYGYENQVGYSPGADASTTLSFPLQPIAWHLTAGSRLRLEVCTNDFPRFPLATNALPDKNAPLAYPRSVRNTIEFDTRGTSRLTLPCFNKDPPSDTLSNESLRP